MTVHLPRRPALPPSAPRPVTTRCPVGSAFSVSETALARADAGHLPVDGPWNRRTPGERRNKRRWTRLGSVSDLRLIDRGSIRPRSNQTPVGALPVSTGCAGANSHRERLNNWVPFPRVGALALVLGSGEVLRGSSIPMCLGRRTGISRPGTRSKRSEGGPSTLARDPAASEIGR